jgi:hypothetical protein
MGKYRKHADRAGKQRPPRARDKCSGDSHEPPVITVFPPRLQSRTAAPIDLRKRRNLWREAALFRTMPLNFRGRNARFA